MPVCCPSSSSCRQEKPEVRQASRDAALREVKERAKKLKAEKAAKAAVSGNVHPCTARSPLQIRGSPDLLSFYLRLIVCLTAS